MTEYGRLYKDNDKLISLNIKKKKMNVGFLGLTITTSFGRYGTRKPHGELTDNLLPTS